MDGVDVGISDGAALIVGKIDGLPLGIAEGISEGTNVDGYVMTKLLSVEEIQDKAGKRCEYN